MEGEKKYTNGDGFVPSTPELEVAKVYEYKELSPEEEARLVDVLEGGRKEPRSNRFGVFLVDGEDETAQLARSVEVRVFGEFFKNDEALMQQEYSPYEANSKFLVVLDQDAKKAVGVMRLVTNSEAGLKSINDLAHEPWSKSKAELFAENDIKEADLDSTVDIATLAVIKGYRGQTEVSASLYNALRKYILSIDAQKMVTILDNNVLDLLESIGCHFKKYEGVEAASYLDSPLSTPVYNSYQEMMDQWQSEQPGTYDYIVLGNGLDVDFEVG